MKYQLFVSHLTSMDAMV